ncbi:hypothetical protein BOTBODRAFT_346432 [Botryobasidium botryosum FD-172 SS1]|uniref:MARVEL domain-containing protein n=1 Tax=Botryobasidium botryosum (strain FD-172 SS1) TaxID=930990 RepID=A0A067MSM3_BOTB1|nr:hypothetical protein BOTBODRAFT_346432 [Botryobasidium botryosum FD-172 SS1]
MSTIRRGHSILFGLMCFFGIIEGSLATWLVTHYEGYSNYPNFTISQSAYITFASWWTVVFSASAIVFFLYSPTRSFFTSVGTHLIFLSLTWIFWTAAAASVTPMTDCTKYAQPYCSRLNALEVFAWIEWGITAITFSIVFFLGVRILRARV